MPLAAVFIFLPFLLLGGLHLIARATAPAPRKCSRGRPCSECVETFRRNSHRPSAPA